MEDWEREARRDWEEERSRRRQPGPRSAFEARGRSRGRVVDRLRDLDVRTVRIGLAALLIVALLVIGAIALLGGGGDEGGGKIGAEGLSESELVDKAGDLDHAAYWIGPDPSAEKYELTQTEDGRIFIRYLPEGAEVGSAEPIFLTVGTYAVPDAKTALQNAQTAGGTKGLSQEQGFMLLKGGNGLNAYVVFDDQPDLQVEIFDPTPGKAVRFAKSGTLRPLE